METITEHPTIWEFTYEVIAGLACEGILQRMNDRGAAGWEAFGVDSTRVYFKRPKVAQTT